MFDRAESWKETVARIQNLVRVETNTRPKNVERRDDLNALGEVAGIVSLV